MIDPIDAMDANIELRISPPAQPISLEDLALIADHGPADSEGWSPPLEEMDVRITGDEMTQMIKDILAGNPSRPSSPYAAKVLEQLRIEIAAMPPGAIVEIPQD
jgi:hypothetical protein